MGLGAKSMKELKLFSLVLFVIDTGFLHATELFYSISIDRCLSISKKITRVSQTLETSVFVC